MGPVLGAPHHSGLNGIVLNIKAASIEISFVLDEETSKAAPPQGAFGATSLIKPKGVSKFELFESLGKGRDLRDGDGQMEMGIHEAIMMNPEAGFLFRF